MEIDASREVESVGETWSYVLGGWWLRVSGEHVIISVALNLSPPLHPTTRKLKVEARPHAHKAQN